MNKNNTIKVIAHYLTNIRFKKACSKDYKDMVKTITMFLKTYQDR